MNIEEAKFTTCNKEENANKQCQFFLSPDSECLIEEYNNFGDNYILVRQNGQYTQAVINQIYRNVTFFVNTNKLLFTNQLKHMLYPQCQSNSKATEPYLRSFIFQPGMRFINITRIFSERII